MRWPTTPTSSSTGRRTGLVAALVDALRDLADVVDLPEVAPEANVRRLVERWPHPVLARPSSTTAHLPARPVEEIVAGFSSRTRGHRRRELRSVAAAGVHHRELRPDEVGGGVARLLTLHRQAWEHRTITLEHTRPRFADFLTRATRAMVRAGDAAVVEHRVGDDVVAVELVLLGRDTAGGYLYGHRPELRTTLNVTAMLLVGRSVAGRRSGARGVQHDARAARPTRTTGTRRRVRHERLVLPLRRSRRAAGYLAAVRVLSVARERLRQDARCRAVVARLRSARALGSRS